MALSYVDSLMSCKRADDESISSAGTQVQHSPVYPDAFFFHKTIRQQHKELEFSLSEDEIWQKVTWSLSTGVGWQEQADIHTLTHPSFPFTARLARMEKQLCPAVPVHRRRGLEARTKGFDTTLHQLVFPEASDTHVQHAVIKPGSHSLRTGEKS